MGHPQETTMKHESIRPAGDIFAVKHYLRTGQRFEPLTVTCACCCEPQDPSDMATSTTWQDDHLHAMADRFGGPVCNGCADDHELCHWCERRVADDDYTAMSADETLRFCSAGCMDDWAGAS